jgi:nicotinamide-nucleotide amidase
MLPEMIAWCDFRAALSVKDLNIEPVLFRDRPLWQDRETSCRSRVIMQDLVSRAERAAAILKGRRATVVVAESSTGGLVSAALLAVPGASSYFLGGAVVYTQLARASLLDIPDTAMAGMRAATQAYALLLARSARQRFSATWALAESGATGPTGNRYGDPPGHTCVAVVGASERAVTLETGSADRLSNMYAFSAAALDLLATALE